MNQELHIFTYLKSYEKSSVEFDLNPVDWNEQQFSIFDWADFYGAIKEAIPNNTPTPSGNQYKLMNLWMPIMRVIN